MEREREREREREVFLPKILPSGAMVLNFCILIENHYATIYQIALIIPDFINQLLVNFAELTFIANFSLTFH